MLSVLLVDDDPDHRELFSRVLTADGPRTLADTHRIDAAVLDVRLPQVGGIELCQALRARPATAELPVLMLSAHAQSRIAEAALDAGADDYLIKPVSRGELLTRLEAVMVRRTIATMLTASRAALLAARHALPLNADRVSQLTAPDRAA